MKQNQPGNQRMCIYAQSCPTLCNPMDCNPASSSVHGISQARTLEWVTITFSRRIFSTQGSNPYLLQVASLGRWSLCHWATQEAQVRKRRMQRWVQAEGTAWQRRSKVSTMNGGRSMIGPGSLDNILNSGGSQGKISAEESPNVTHVAVQRAKGKAGRPLRRLLH